MIEIAGGILLAVFILAAVSAWGESRHGRGSARPETEQYIRSWFENREYDEQRREQSARHQRWLDKWGPRP